MMPDVIATLIGGGLFIFLLVVWVIFCVMLVIAPLMVWKWAKRICAAVEREEEFNALAVGCESLRPVAGVQRTVEINMRLHQIGGHGQRIIKIGQWR